MTLAESLSNVADEELMAWEADLLMSLDDPNLTNETKSMLGNDLSIIQAEMVSRGLLNNGLQGAPRTLGLLSGAVSALDGATTSTSTSSAHGAMRTHVANTNNDPREGLYEY